MRLGAEASLLTGSDGHDETSTLLAQGEKARRLLGWLSVFCLKSPSLDLTSALELKVFELFVCCPRVRILGRVSFS